MKIKPLVTVYWNDAYGEVGEFENESPNYMARLSSGYLVKRTDEVVVVAQDYCPDDNSYHTYTVIPRELVTKVRKLK